DSGFTVGKIEDVKATSGKVRAEGSAIGHGKRAVVVLMSLGIAAAFTVVYIIRKKGTKKDVSSD
ncbi:MAG: hypothetical protein KBT31_02625, partial [Firmicutes bacterium]|nr:hypothetical protein [Candidatus Colimorpha enterica]